MKTILFDLDGTLLPINDKMFEKVYIGTLVQYLSGFESSPLKRDAKELAKAVWDASTVMIASNDDTKTNEVVFWEAFESNTSREEAEFLMSVMDVYYNDHFIALKEHTSVHDGVVEAVRYLKEKGHRVILATNPMLPKLATDKRIEWAGFDLDDFDAITRFETAHHCKPNPKYYEEIIQVNNLDPKKCIMIGNDVQEDMMARELGMEGWLLSDDLIHRSGEIVCDWMGTRDELLDRVKEVFA